MAWMPDVIAEAPEIINVEVPQGGWSRMGELSPRRDQEARRAAACLPGGARAGRCAFGVPTIGLAGTGNSTKRRFFKSTNEVTRHRRLIKYREMANVTA
jgi:hypothetical protein